MIIYLRTPSEHPLRCHETKPFIVIDTDGSFLVRRFLFFVFIRLSLVSTHHLDLYWKKNRIWEEGMEEKTVTIIKLSHHDALAQSDCNLWLCKITTLIYPEFFLFSSPPRPPPLTAPFCRLCSLFSGLPSTMHHIWYCIYEILASLTDEETKRSDYILYKE